MNVFAACRKGHPHTRTRRDAVHARSFRLEKDIKSATRRRSLFPKTEGFAEKAVLPLSLSTELRSSGAGSDHARGSSYAGSYAHAHIIRRFNKTRNKLQRKKTKTETTFLSRRRWNTAFLSQGIVFVSNFLSASCHALHSAPLLV